MSKSSDNDRYGRKFSHYLFAMSAIRLVLAQGEENLDKNDLDNLLRRLLEPLRMGSNSQFAFVADQAGKILYVDPPNNDLVNRLLPIDAIERKKLYALRDLVEHGTPLTVLKEPIELPQNIEEIKEVQEYLHTLSAKSMLIVCLDSYLGVRFVGVCNGENLEEDYLGEDQHFLDELIGLLAGSLNYGHAQAKSETQKQSAKDNYDWALLRGEYAYLSRASEDYASALLDQ